MGNPLNGKGLRLENHNFSLFLLIQTYQRKKEEVKGFHNVYKWLKKINIHLAGSKLDKKNPTTSKVNQIAECVEFCLSCTEKNRLIKICISIIVDNNFHTIIAM